MITILLRTIYFSSYRQTGGTDGGDDGGDDGVKQGTRRDIPQLRKECLVREIGSVCLPVVEASPGVPHIVLGRQHFCKTAWDFFIGLECVRIRYTFHPEVPTIFIRNPMVVQEAL